MANISALRILTRTVQGVCALLALITTAGGYLELKNGQLSSAAAIYAEIANYSAMLCALYYALGLGVFKNHVRVPLVTHQRIVDAALVVALAIAGAVHLRSQAVRECASINSMFTKYHGYALFSCSRMTTGVVLTFVTMALFLATLVWSFMRDATVSSSNASGNVQGEEEIAAANAASGAYGEVGTPSLKAGLMMDTELTAQSATSYRLARRSGRVLQLVCSAMALITTVVGYKHYYTGQYISVSATYVILMAYTCTLYSLWHVAAVEGLQVCRAPKASVERIVDGVLAVAFVVGGAVFATSSRVKSCDELNESFMAVHGSEPLFRCGAMDTGVVFTFIAVAMFLVTFLLGFASRSAARATTSEEEATQVEQSQA
ncbi:hypothetical protein Gpo141_00014162 [Globisporangium polare]